MFIDLPPERRRFVLSACIAAVFTAAVEGTIVATAMPTIVTELGGFSLFSWVFASYMLTQAVTIPIYGRLADLYGRRRILFVGLGLFLVGSTLCGFAGSIIQLVLFRALQGFGAGAIMPIALTIVGDIYTPVERVRIQPYLAGVFASSSIAGPVFGALIVNRLGWPLIFWVNVPVCIIAIAMLAVFLPERRQVVEHTIDLVGAALLMLAIGLLLLPLLEAQALRAWIVPLLLLSVVCFAAFIRQERRSPEPLLPVLLWRDRTILACNLGAFFIGATLLGATAFLPTYLQGVMDKSVFDAGLVLAVMSISWPAAAVTGGRLILRTSYRTVALSGAAVYTCGALLLPLVAIFSGDGPLGALGTWWPAVAAAMIGAGMGMCNSSYQVAVQEASSVNNRGAATAAYNFMRMLGATFGTAILGAVLNFSVALRLPQALDPVQTLMDRDKPTALTADELSALTRGVGAALHDVFWAGAIVSLAAIAVARLLPRGTRPGHRPAASEQIQSAAH